MVWVNYNLFHWGKRDPMINSHSELNWNITIRSKTGKQNIELNGSFSSQLCKRLPEGINCAKPWSSMDHKGITM